MACGRTEYLNDPEAPKPNSLVPAAGVLAVDPDGRVLLQRRRDTGQWAIPMGKQEIGETRQEYEIIFLGEPVSGEPAANDEASAAGWHTRAELPGLDIHPSQRRQLGHWMNGTYPHYD